MNYKTHEGVPSAHLTRKKSRLKIYNGNKVFLNDGDNFEFELHNPKQKSVLVKIKLNGEYISTSGIVLKPGQRVFLERFLDTNNKFEFSTYKVKDTSENRSAIDLNGDVLVEFYDEQEYQHQYYNRVIYNGGILSGNNDYIPRFGTTFTTTGLPINGTTTLYNSSNLSYTSSVSGDILRTSPKAKKSKTIETGRVEKGGSSNQTFTNSYQNFNYHTSRILGFKILPYPEKNIEVKEIRQYCTECGVKVKKNFKFCPSCGNKL